MISDTLHDANAEIGRYQRDMPECYDGLRHEIEKVKAVMDALRAYLDCPPSTGRYPRYAAALDRLRSEIARINLDGVLAALNGVKSSWPTPEEVEETKDFRPTGQLFAYDPEEVLARAIDVYFRDGGRDQPSSAASEVDDERHEVRLRNVHGLLATYKIGRNGTIRRTCESEEQA